MSTIWHNCVNILKVNYMSAWKLYMVLYSFYLCSPWSPLLSITPEICAMSCLLLEFDVHRSVHRKYIPIYIQQDATLHSLFISGNCCTCFGCYFHPSSGAHTAVSTASGICHAVTATCRYRGGVPTPAVTAWQIPDAVDTVVCTPDDGWR